MNIIVKVLDGRVCCRPDTTWERESKDLYVPDGVALYSHAPVAFARVSKAGKCIGRRFADRYFDAFGFGTLLYADDDMLYGSCHDRTSVLPGPLNGKDMLGASSGDFVLTKNGLEIFRCSSGGMEDVLCEALVRSSEKVSLRIGDYVAAELCGRTVLLSREEGASRLGASFCGNQLFDFNVIF